MRCSPSRTACRLPKPEHKTGMGRNGTTTFLTHPKTRWKKMTCTLCEEPITNPICPCCVREGIRQWLHEENQEQLIPSVDEATRNIFRNDGTTDCIKCHSLMSVCVYCYTKEIFHLVKHDPKLLLRYLTYFNYDLGHLGWQREAEQLLVTEA